jgi:hypothetical protein
MDEGSWYVAWEFVVECYCCHASGIRASISWRPSEQDWPV